MAKPCYSGPNPIDTQEDRIGVWNWAKANGIDAGIPIEKVYDAINQKFYGGQAKPEWITDILSGRKTPFKEQATEMWKKQYNRRLAQQQARELSQIGNMTPLGKFLRALWTAPRSLAVAGHGVVFPITHAGDLLFRPQDWGTFIKGTLSTYKGAFNTAFTKQSLDAMKFGTVADTIPGVNSKIAGDSMFDFGLRSGVDMGEKSHPSGLISRSYHGPAQRAWDMLTVLRYNLWKKAMARRVTSDMTPAEVLETGQKLAGWANNATGSGKGFIAKLGGALFGPKLTQAKANRIFADPVTTAKTFANWDNATAGEKAVAQERLSGATQFLLTNLGFLGVNAGLLYALGQKDQKINISDPTKGDFLAFKGAGIRGNVPGLHTEIRTVAKILAAAFMSRKELHGETRFERIAKTAGQYGMGKLTPTIQRGLEVGFGQDWLGRPLPWSSEKGTPSKPRLTWGQYAASVGPIPLEGPVSYVYDQLHKGGMSKLDATTLVKALTIGGLGAPGFHVVEDYSPRQFNPNTDTKTGIK